MDVSAIAKIRDTRGLDIYEKMFLITVASHRDGMFKTHEKNYADMAMSRPKYYKVRGDLMDKKLIEVQRRYDNSTVYTINTDELDAWCLSHVETPKELSKQSPTETAKSLTETPKSPTETQKSLRDNTKDNLKDNLTNNMKENLVTPTNKNTTHAPAARPDNHPYSTTSSALSEPEPMNTTTPGESLTETFVPTWKRTAPDEEELQRYIAERKLKRETR